MLVIVKSTPETTEGKRAVLLARDMAADLVCLQDGVYFVSSGELNDFSGSVYLLDEDLKLRGLSDVGIRGNMRKVDYDALIDLLVGSDKVVGML